MFGFSGGVGEAALYLVMDYMFEMVQRKKEVDMFGCVLKLRQERQGMIPFEVILHFNLYFHMQIQLEGVSPGVSHNLLGGVHYFTANYHTCKYKYKNWDNCPKIVIYICNKMSVLF